MCDKPRAPNPHRSPSINTTTTATSNKLIIIIFAQPLPLSRPLDKEQQQGAAGSSSSRQAFVFARLGGHRSCCSLPCPGSCRESTHSSQIRISQGATRCPKDAARCPSPLAVCTKLHFVYQLTHEHTHTDLHKDVLMMCLDYGHNGLKRTRTPMRPTPGYL